MEECSVCYSDNYIQNSRFACQHPLCISCLYNLKEMKCPICRTIKTIPYIVCKINKITVYCPITKWINYVFSLEYKNRLSKFLFNRRTNKKIILFVNRIRKEHKFLIINKQILELDEFSKHNLIDYIMNKRFSNVNRDILKSMLIRM